MSTDANFWLRFITARKFSLNWFLQLRKMFAQPKSYTTCSNNHGFSVIIQMMKI